MGVGILASCEIWPCELRIFHTESGSTPQSSTINNIQARLNSFYLLTLKKTKTKMETVIITLICCVAGVQAIKVISALILAIHQYNHEHACTKVTIIDDDDDDNNDNIQEEK